MSSSQLLNSTFKRICDFTEKCGFKIQKEKTIIEFYFNPNAKKYNYDWMWRNRKELLLGCKKFGILSLFTNIIVRYEYFKKYNIKNTEPISEPISENTSNFIDVCRFLNGCHSVEEVAFKMDLIGI
jgi:hypothetical protein